MKAARIHNYGEAEVIRLDEIERPRPGEKQIVIKMRGSSLNHVDLSVRAGELKLITQFQLPKTLGFDLVGEVAECGAGVTSFLKGQRVAAMTGMAAGGAAEYCCVDQDQAARLPEGLEWAEAAAAPLAGCTALQALRDSGGLAPGERVLVWGASGGVGHFAVQIAGVLGASRVDAVASGRNAAMLAGLGADAVADYTKQEVPEGPYDLIIDTVATASMRTLRSMLAEGGRVVTVGSVAGTGLLGPAAALLRRVVAAKFLRMNHRGAIAKVAHDDLVQLASWLEDGRIAPVVHHAGALEDVAGAVRELEAGHVAGKLTIAVSADARASREASTRAGADPRG